MHAGPKPCCKVPSHGAGSACNQHLHPPPDWPPCAWVRAPLQHTQARLYSFPPTSTPFDSQAAKHHLHTTCRCLTKACCSSPAVKSLRPGPSPGHGRQACSGDTQALVKTPVRAHGCVRGSSCQAAVVAHPPPRNTGWPRSKDPPRNPADPPTSMHTGTAPRSRFPGADVHASTFHVGSCAPPSSRKPCPPPPHPTGVASSPHQSSQQHPAQHPGSKATGLHTIAPPQQLPTKQAMCWLCCRGHCRRCCTTALPNKKSKDPAARHIHKEGTKQPISWLSWT